MLKIKIYEVALVGVATQHAIDEHGHAVDKHRPVHDQSFYFSPGNSVNHRLIKENLPPLQHGFCFLRVLHHDHSLRLCHPNIYTMMSKVDIKLACRRGTMPAELPSKSITILCGMALFLCCLPFVGAHYPNLWCIASEMITDIWNNLLLCND